jgi:hypothetical protein
MRGFVSSCLVALAASKQPHVVIMVLDDIGWADVSYHGGDFPTPAIDGLATTGVDLTRWYIQPVCSPTRSSIMTGRFPFHTGMQHYTTLAPGTTAHMPTDQETVAELFKKSGYDTHGTFVVAVRVHVRVHVRVSLWRFRRCCTSTALNCNAYPPTPGAAIGKWQ